MPYRFRNSRQKWDASAKRKSIAAAVVEKPFAIASRASRQRKFKTHCSGLCWNSPAKKRSRVLKLTRHRAAINSSLNSHSRANRGQSLIPDKMLARLFLLELGLFPNTQTESILFFTKLALFRLASFLPSPPTPALRFITTCRIPGSAYFNHNFLKEDNKEKPWQITTVRCYLPLTVN